MGLAGRAWSLQAWGARVESGWEDRKRKAEPDCRSHGFLGEMDYKSHEALLHIQADDIGGMIPTSPWSTLESEPRNCSTLDTVWEESSKYRGAVLTPDQKNRNI